MSEETAAFKISDSSDNFSTWFNKPYISPSLKDEIKKAEILFIPIENFRESKSLSFPVKTEELFTFFRERLKEKVNICVENSDYTELALHFDTIIIGTFIVTALFLPTFTNVLSSYISDKLLKSKKDATIKLTLTVEYDKSISKKLEFEGNISEFGKAMDTINKLEV